MKIFAILVATAALFFAGCRGGQPIHNVDKAPVITASGKPASMAQVSTAIVRAGTRLGWQMKPTGKGRVNGTLVVRDHTANIEVDHDTKTYTIRYKDSVNLNAKDGTIHPNYNSWIQNLDRNIRAELAQL
jgi:hypothetical protein